GQCLVVARHHSLEWDNVLPGERYAIVTVNCCCEAGESDFIGSGNFIDCVYDTLLCDWDVGGENCTRDEQQREGNCDSEGVFQICGVRCCHRSHSCLISTNNQLRQNILHRCD